jgi:hypothetical protein
MLIYARGSKPPPRRRRLLDFPQQAFAPAPAGWGRWGCSPIPAVSASNHATTVSPSSMPQGGESGENFEYAPRNLQTDIGPPDFDVHFTQIVIRRGGLCRTH